MSVDVAAPERIVIAELAPEPSTAAQVVGAIVGSFILASVGLGIDLLLLRTNVMRTSEGMASTGDRRVPNTRVILRR
jgi:hypothetical protein